MSVIHVIESIFPVYDATLNSILSSLLHSVSYLYFYFNFLQDEIPYSCEVVIDSFKDKSPQLSVIEACIVVSESVSLEGDKETVKRRECKEEDVGEIVWCAVTLRGNRQRCYGVTRREQKLLMRLHHDLYPPVSPHRPR